MKIDETKLQVAKNHYDFAKYQSEARFSSFYHQVKALSYLAPKSVLEVGVGDGIFGAIVKNAGYDYKSLDYDKNLNPDICASLFEIPLDSNSFDVVSAFQVLEHIEFERLGEAVAELYRVCKQGAAISLPDVGSWSLVINIPFVRKLSFVFRLPRILKFKHKFDGEHYWEINKNGYDLEKIITIFEGVGFSLINTWSNPYHPYHRFFSLKKN